MRALIQRVARATVRVEGEAIAEIGPGLVAFVAARVGDTGGQAEAMGDKIANLRIMGDGGGKMNRSVLETGGAVLVVSQFTLYADTQRGRRPSFVDAAPPEEAEPLVSLLAARLEALGVPTETGAFGAHMEVELLNDGPVTILVET